MSCWETFGPGIHVDVTPATSLNTVADSVHPLMAVYSPMAAASFKGIMLPATLQKMYRNRFWEMTEFKVLTLCPNSPDLSPIEHLWDVLEQV